MCGPTRHHDMLCVRKKSGERDEGTKIERTEGTREKPEKRTKRTHTHKEAERQKRRKTEEQQTEATQQKTETDTDMSR